MSGIDRLAASAERLQRHFAGPPESYGTWTARRPHTLHASEGLVTFAVLDDPAASGALAIVLRGASGTLNGGIPAGLVLEIAGTEYTAAQDGRADAGLLTVVLGEAIGDPAAEGDAVQVAAYAEFSLPESSSVMASAKSVPAEWVEVVTREVLVPKRLATRGYLPRSGDLLISPDESETLRVATFSTDQPGLWGLFAGSAT